MDGELGHPDDEFDDEDFYKRFGMSFHIRLSSCPNRSKLNDILLTRHVKGEPPRYCWSRQDVHTDRRSWLSITIFALSIYSTVMSGIWLIVAFVQPRWGHGISSSGGVLPSTATLVTALVAKTIEMSFVTVFISCLGQVLTRRAFLRNTAGMTLAEMTMRNWVIQPGSLLTHFEVLPYAAVTVLGALALTATFAGTFYTTASDAMVAPKLKYGDWQHKELTGYFRASYANINYVADTCAAVFSRDTDPHGNESCMNVAFSGQSYRNLQSYMTTWTAIYQNGTSTADTLTGRPSGTMLLYDNTTMEAAWIETEHGNVTALSTETGRIINNVTMAMPHPGVYGAARLPENDILQPDDLAGVGEYTIKAAVVSPAINVMCVNMDLNELAPLIYTAWPHAHTEPTNVSDQVIGKSGWDGEVPPPTDKNGQDNYLNRTVVDDIFQWGPKYYRRPPVFQLVSSAQHNF